MQVKHDIAIMVNHFAESVCGLPTESLRSNSLAAYNKNCD